MAEVRATNAHGHQMAGLGHVPLAQIPRLLTSCEVAQGR
jgi:hypothetical protein|eukprot:SAG25_NODE_158_length_13455_cov_15.344714_13_plen_39_part_00